MNWLLLGRALRLAFLLRVPLFMLLLLAALGPLAKWSSASDLLDNLLDQGTHPWDIFTVSFSAFLLAFTGIATLNLTLYYGTDRLDERGTFPMCQRRPLLTFILGTATAAVLMGFVVARTEGDTWLGALTSGLGAVCAMGLVLASKFIQLALTDPNTTPHPPPFLVFPARKIPVLIDWFDTVYCWSSDGSNHFKSRVNAGLQWPLEILRGAGQGYLVDLNAPAGKLILRSGHVFALALSILAFGFFIGIGFFKKRITAEGNAVPALAYVLLFLIVACWFLAALTFFFDRYRFPLLWTLGALALITASVPQSDHFFRVENRDLRSVEYLTPAKYLRQKLRGGKKPLVFVATPGGGIQAAAWTAQVLSGLDNDYTNFRDSVCLISSVSGGSLGSMVYAASFAGNIGQQDVISKAEASAIDEVAWGWTNPDLWRAIAPWFGERTIDRGWAVERKWSEVNNLKRGTFLSDWAKRGTEIPALIFNSMLVERGQHVVFSTTKFPKANDPRGIADFYGLYPDRAGQYDIRVNTAARLSASFPYVAPASRPNLNSPYAGDFHFVDGGYYDNYGIDSVIGWLSDALESDSGLAAGFQDVMVLQIRHFNESTAAPGSRQGWGFQLYAPLAGLLSMWNEAPVYRDQNELRLFQNWFHEKTGKSVRIATMPFDGKAGCAKAPLSWKLSESQKGCIANTWKALDCGAGTAFQSLTDYLGTAKKTCVEGGKP